MNEFKGTKGKWTLGDGTITYSQYNITSQDGSVYIGEVGGGLISKDENRANAQLISKAPEMLDFINRISGEMLRNDFVLNEKWYDQAQELIKEATTI